MTTAFYTTKTVKLGSALTVTSDCPNCGKTRQELRDAGPAPLDLDRPAIIRMTCTSCRIHWFATSPS